MRSEADVERSPSYDEKSPTLLLVISAIWLKQAARGNRDAVNQTLISAIAQAKMDTDDFSFRHDIRQVAFCNLFTMVPF